MIRQAACVSNKANLFQVCSRCTSSHPLFKPLIERNRSVLARAITLTESTLEPHKENASSLMSDVLKHNASLNTLRIGISGPPGAGKSTFIETFGLHLADMGNRVAVLAVDPSSSLSGGSLLADKTRMQHLSVHKSAFIRPSPSRGHLGGVARATNDAIQLCEAGGYNVVIVETVGAGQSEIAVANMTDIFVLLVPPGSGDELQGIKKGIVEVADMILVTKADGNLKTSARMVKTEYSRAMRLLRSDHANAWKPFVTMISSVTGEGINESWEDIKEFKEAMLESGQFQQRRQRQRISWLWDYVQEELLDLLRSDKSVCQLSKELEGKVREGSVTSSFAAHSILKEFLKRQ